MDMTTEQWNEKTFSEETKEKKISVNHDKRYFEN